MSTVITIRSFARIVELSGVGWPHDTAVIERTTEPTAENTEADATPEESPADESAEGTESSDS